MTARRSHTAFVVALFALGAFVPLAASHVRAQGSGGELSPDLRDIVPYMMVVVDTSGSMERLPVCTCTTAACVECLPGGQASPPVADGCALPNVNGVPPTAKKNRWAVTLEALTGTYMTNDPDPTGTAYAGFQCEKLARTLENGMSYDLGYFMPYHQPWDCAGTTSRACPYRNPTATCSTDANCQGLAQPFCVAGRCEALRQNPDGILDQYKAQVQFGLMAFDGWDTYVGFPPLVPATDFNTTLSEGKSGLWSYGGDVCV